MRLRLLRRPLWSAFTVLVVAVAVGCLLMGWWQFGRLMETGGDPQNLGYTLQWPGFAAFAIFLWWKLLGDAAHPDDNRSGRTARIPAPQPRHPSRVPVLANAAAKPRPIDESDDPELAAYNRYLASLNARAGGGAPGRPARGDT